MKPICFFDLETTGTVIGTDRIVEIAILKVSGEGQEKYHTRVNPEMEIPQGAIDVHGISNEDVQDKPTLKEIALDVKKFMSGCDVGGYNSNFFDIPLLYFEMNRVNIPIDFSTARFIDAGVIFKRMEARTLSAAVQFYLGREHEGAHGALSDTEATFEVVKEMRLRYPEIGEMGMSELSLYCNYDNPRADISGKFTIDEDGDYVFNFGKHKGEKAKNEQGFLQWMIGKDFLPDTKELALKLIKR
jgi:DNA polymerase III subunit epsilon